MFVGVFERGDVGEREDEHANLQASIARTNPRSELPT
jgi:hypothetical protein